MTTTVSYERSLAIVPAKVRNPELRELLEPARELELHADLWRIAMNRAQVRRLASDEPMPRDWQARQAILLVGHLC